MPHRRHATPRRRRAGLGRPLARLLRLLLACGALLGDGLPPTAARALAAEAAAPAPRRAAPFTGAPAPLPAVFRPAAPACLSQEQAVPPGATFLPLVGRPEEAPGTNRWPQAAGCRLALAAGQQISLDLRALASDPDGDPLAFRLLGAPSRGEATLTASTLVYRSPGGASGTERIAYEASDGRGGAARAVVAVELHPGEPPAPPPSPGGLRALAVGERHVALAWDAVAAEGGPASYELFADGAPAGTTAGTSYTLGGLEPDTSYTLTLRAVDAYGQASPPGEPLEVVTLADSPLPTDPSLLAPPVDPSLPTGFADAVSFLYEGDDPAQSEVAPGALVRGRLAVLRGRVSGPDGAPLPGVRVSVARHPEVGHTLTRADGLFDLAVNGGELLTILYELPGHLPAQRRLAAPVGDYAWAPDVVLVPLDGEVTAVAAGAGEAQVARGSLARDEDGERRATLIFPPGFTATMVLAGGEERELDELSVRLTEYTVGPSGPEAMPAPLPTSSGYTYAVEYSVDEAIAAGAREVRFDRPLAAYVENFLGFPVGGDVPSGYLDRARGAWVAAEDGRVVRVVGASGGLAELDLTGDGEADDPAEIGVEEGELARLAELYPVGQELWRVPVQHFTPYDYNWPAVPPRDAVGPDGRPLLDGAIDDPCERPGSIVACENQSLGEALPLAGTPFSLRYQSDRVPGDLAARTITIPVASPYMPPILRRIRVEIEVAGRRFVEEFPSDRAEPYVFTWDGVDGYGRLLNGPQTARYRIGYVYPIEFAYLGDSRPSFGRYGADARLDANRAAGEITIWRSYTATISALRWSGLGGWSLDAHHVYDPATNTLFRGDGGRQSVRASGRSLARIKDGVSDTNYSVAVGPDGSVYFSDIIRDTITRILPIRNLADPWHRFFRHRIAGTGDSGFSGDDGPALEAQLANPAGLALAPDGGLYVADAGNGRLRRVAPDGTITTVAGGGTVPGWYAPNGTPATSLLLSSPSGVAVAPDGNVYLSDVGWGVVFQIGTDGLATIVAGRGSGVGDGRSGGYGGLDQPHGLAVGPDGSLYIADSGHHRIRKISPGGIISTVAGAGMSGFDGDGTLARFAKLNYPSAVAVAPDGSLYIGDTRNCRVRHVSVEGLISTVAGSGCGHNDSGPATQAQLGDVTDVALGGDGSLYIASERLQRTIHRVVPAQAGQSGPTLIVPSSDGTELYLVTPAGRHLETRDALTGAVIFSFSYDAAGRLAGIADRDGNVTRVERDAAGSPTAIVGPYGHRTGLALDELDYLASVTDPAGAFTRLSHTSSGLLVALTDPRGHTHRFDYDSLGRLVRDENPAGGSTSLERFDRDWGAYRVTITNALGDATVHEVDPLDDGVQRRTVTAPDGGTTVSEALPDGRQTIEAPNGLRTETATAADPRWGLQAPYVRSLTLKAPAGALLSSMVATRTVALADPSDPLSLEAQSESITANGRTTTTTYDAASPTLTTTDPAGRASIKTFDGHGRVTRVEATGQASISYEYDSAGRISRLVEGEGEEARATAFVYDGRGDLAQRIDPLGGTTAYTYDAVGRLLTETLPTGHVLRYAYDANGNRIAAVDAQGVTTIYEYDAQNRPVAAIRNPEEIAVRTELSYDAAGNLVEQVDDAGADRLNLTTRYSYAPVGTSGYAVASVTDPLGATTSYSYDQAGDLREVTDPRGRSTVMSYTPQGRPIAVTTPGGGTSTTAYNLDGQPVRVTDPRGVTTLFTYDAAGRLQTTSAGASPVDGEPSVSLTSTFGYDAAGRLVSIADGLGQTSTRAYDTFGRLVEERDATGRAIGYSYDRLDRLVRQTVGGHSADESITTAYSYDAAGRLLAEVQDPGGLGLLTEYRYAREGSPDTWNLQEVVDPRGSTTTYGYDSLGWRTEVIDALRQVWRFSYDNLGRLTEQLDPLGGRIGYEHDGAGRVVAETHGGRTRRWRYAEDGALVERVDAGGRSTYLSYDLDGRLATIDYPEGTADASFAYDPAGNLTWMGDGLGETTYRYDALNRLVERARDGRSIAYGYDGAGRASTIDYWGSGTIEYGYDEAGRATRLDAWGEGSSSYVYDAAGQLGTQARGNGVTTDYDFDAAGRLMGMLHVRGAAELLPIRYQLDANGNRTQQSDDDGVTRYAYDALDRLASVDAPAIPAGPRATTTSLAYDAVGNRLGAGESSYSYDDEDRITSPGFVYDENGNLLSDGQTSYRYDAADRLVETVAGGATTSYGYDGRGNLVRVTVDGVTTDLVLDERGALPVVLGEVRSDGAEIHYAYGPEGMSAQRRLAGADWQVSYSLLDGLGSVRQLTGAGGEVTLRRSYGAFGVLRHQSGDGVTTLGFAGERAGADGTIYLRARHYHPGLGRFLQRDTFAGYLDVPETLNRYAYAANNPISRVDPSGHDAFGDMWMLGLGPSGTATFALKNAPEILGWLSWLNRSVCLLDVLQSALDIAGLVPGLGEPLDFVNGLISLARGRPIEAGLSFAAMLPIGGWAATGAKFGLRYADEALGIGRWGLRQADEGQGAVAAVTYLPGVSCLNSFSADTPVATPEGERPIEEIRVGDEVLAYDEATGETTTSTVTAALVHEDPATVRLTIDGETVDTTPEHPFYVADAGWVAADELEAGDRVRTIDGEHGTVEAMAVEVAPRVMYNLTVADAHTFFVGGGRWLVHNTSCGIGTWNEFQAANRGKYREYFKYIEDDGSPRFLNSRQEAASAWRMYQEALQSDKIAAIGTRKATLAAREEGYQVLDTPGWSLEVNDAWIDGLISRRAIIRIVSEESDNTLKNPLNNTETVFAREIRRLENAGYVRQGEYLVPGP